jgi:carboxypeptidase T
MKTVYTHKRILNFILISVMLISGEAPALAQQPSLTPTQEEPRDIPVVARVYFISTDDLNQLASSLDIWEVNHEAGYLVTMLSSKQYASLQLAGYHLEVDEDKTKLLTQHSIALPGQGTDSIPGYPCYRTVEDTYQSMQDIATEYPVMAQIFDIGDSWTRLHFGSLNGFDILALRLTNENFGSINDKPTFFLMAEIHAREYTTAETAMRFAEYLLHNYGTDPDITWLLDYYRVYIVTMTNPDGRKIAETGVWWRKNVDNGNGCSDSNSWGTDLNRNHSFHWNGNGSSPNPCDETYRGPAAGSEPETQAIQNFVLTLFPDQRGTGDTDPAPVDTTGLFISLHSYARVVVYPWGWSSSPAPNSTELATLGRKFGFFNQYEVCQSNSSCMYPTNGTSDDWAYGNLGIASFTFEIGVNFFESCASFESTTYLENLPALVYAFKAARRPYQNPAGPDSVGVTVSPAAVLPGETVLLTATADDTRYDSNGWGTEPTQNISEARYSIDDPSWITNTVTFPMTASDGSFDSKIEAIEGTIDTTVLSPGRHTIFVESKDVDNNWGVINAIFLTVLTPPDAGFSCNSPVPLGQPVIFTNQTTGSEPITYSWDFGDSISTSAEINPSYTYAATGTFNVTLVAANIYGVDTVTKTVTVLPSTIMQFLPLASK